jgi:YidC/Oxa1 family membrane protein insertase
MQQQSSSRNLILAIALCAGILFGWPVLMRWIDPPKPKPPVEPTPAEVLAKLAASPEGRDAGLGAYLATIGSPVPAAAGEIKLASKLLALQPPPKPVEPTPPKPEVASAKPELITLGDDDSFLKVTLTTLGGAVHDTVLNEFKAADEMGREVPGKNLHLVPGPTPSFTLTHYEKPDEEHPRPLDTLERLVWKREPLPSGVDPKWEARFSATVPGFDLVVTKIYTLRPHDYHVGLTLRFARPAGAQKSPQGGEFRYQLSGPRRTPIEGVWYTSTFRNALFGFYEGTSFRRTLEDAGQIQFTAGGRRHEFFRGSPNHLRYALIATQYFASGIVVDDQQPDQNFIEFVRATAEETAHREHPFLDDITVRVISERMNPDPGTAVEHKFLLYQGPAKVSLLGQMPGVDPALVTHYKDDLNLRTITDYQSPTWIGSVAGSIGWSSLVIACTNLMHWLLNFMHGFIPVYGLCIILLTVMVRGLLHPFSRRQQAAGQKMQAQMARLKPEIEKLQAKHKDDFAAFNRARTELFLKNGINPLAQMGGCLLLLAQTPIFMGLYYALQESIFFRLTPFLWIPNLAAPDMLLWWSEKIPLISTPESLGGFLYLGPFLNILPIIAVGLMLVHQTISMPPPTDEQQAMQYKMMKWMTVFFAIFFYRMPAGLCIYFIASSLWALTERKLIPKPKVADLVVTTSTGGSPPTNGPGGKAVRPKPGGPRGGKGRGRSEPEKPKGKLQSWWAKVLEEARKK